MNSTYPIVFMAAAVIYFLLTSIHTPHEGQEIKEIWHGHVIWVNSSEVPGQSANTNVTPGPDIRTNLRTTSKEPFTVHQPTLRPEPINLDKDIEEINVNKLRVPTSRVARRRGRVSTEPKLWGKKDNGKYDEVAKVMKALDDLDIDSFLCHGSALGAHRNHGWISGDKDADLIVMSTDSKKIEKALKMASYNPGHSKGTFKPQTDGRGPGGGGFGYHVQLKSEKYMDLWLYEEVSDEKVQLIGYERGAHRWCKKYNRPQICKAWPKSWLYKMEYVPFGPYLMASAHKEFLDYMYSDTWRYMCGGWAKGKTSCSRFYNSQTFVFWSQDKEGNRVATAKKGNKTQHQFVVKNGEYKLKYINP